MLPFFKLHRNTKLSGFCACLVVFLVEFLDTSCGIHNFLCAGIKRMAFRADFNVHRGFGDCRLGLEAVATAAGDGDFSVSWMNVVFHLVILGQ